MKIKNKGLGKGLDALIKPDFYEEKSRKADITNISINKIEPNRHQPRISFDDDTIEELGASIKKQGVIQPILVRKTDAGLYQIIAGERRWRASIIAGLKTIPALVRDYSDTEALAIALIENLQREDLNIMEQARALATLKHELRISQEELADNIGKSRSHVANTLRLINLPEEIQEHILSRDISAGHARAILGIMDKGQMLDIAKKIIENNLSVRETENLIKSLNKPVQKKRAHSEQEQLLGGKMQKLITDKVNKGLKVQFRGNSEKGRLVISYCKERQLQDLLTVLEKVQKNEN